MQNNQEALTRFPYITAPHCSITVGKALRGAELESWESAMREELQTILRNQTWTLVQHPPGVTILNPL